MTAARDAAAMTREEAETIADIDKTIRHWRNIGVCAENIGRQLKTRHNWAGIRRKMIVMAIPPREMPSEAAIIALIGSRVRRRLSQRDVAHLLGVSQAAMSHYESG